MSERTASCKSRWRGHKNSRLRALRAMLAAEEDGRESEEYGPLNEYALAFDYVAPGTFKDQREGYWRYQISWGGPSDEIRFYASGNGRSEPYRITYTFLDWFDGHERALVGQDYQTALKLWQWFESCESTTFVYDKAMEDAQA